MEIERITIVAHTHYKRFENHICQVCKSSIMFPPLEVSKEYGNSEITDYPVVENSCGHIYHTICVNNYITKKAKICPACHKIYKPKMNLDNLAISV